MPRLGVPELLVIFLIVIVIFGANRLPQLGRGIGSAIKNFKEGVKDGNDEKAVLGEEWLIFILVLVFLGE